MSPGATSLISAVHRFKEILGRIVLICTILTRRNTLKYRKVLEKHINFRNDTKPVSQTSRKTNSELRHFRKVPLSAATQWISSAASFNSDVVRFIACPSAQDPRVDYSNVKHNIIRNTFRKNI